MDSLGILVRGTSMLIGGVSHLMDVEAIVKAINELNDMPDEQFRNMVNTPQLLLRDSERDLVQRCGAQYDEEEWSPYFYGCGFYALVMWKPWAIKEILSWRSHAQPAVPSDDFLVSYWLETAGISAVQPLTSADIAHPNSYNILPIASRDYVMQNTDTIVKVTGEDGTLTWFNKTNMMIPAVDKDALDPVLYRGVGDIDKRFFKDTPYFAERL